MDQSAINKIIMDAESEDPARKLEKLEKEFQILKGSIKKLILDIREQMNNAENPFLNIQQIQAPAPVPRIETPAPEDIVIEPEEKSSITNRDEAQFKPEETGMENKMIEMEEQSRMLEDMMSRTRDSLGTGTRIKPGRIDPFTMTRLMEWTRAMIRKNGMERFNDLIEMYVLTGYINEDMKVVIQKVAKLMETEPHKAPRRLDIKDCVSDLYALNIILNPKDKEFDSKMLSVLLNAETRQ